LVGRLSIPAELGADASFAGFFHPEFLYLWRHSMFRDSRNGDFRHGRLLASVLIAGLALAGCESKDESGEVVAPTKGAIKRQNEMYKFMKGEGKDVKAAKIAPPTVK
jgi:hypothetical protein